MEMLTRSDHLNIHLNMQVVSLLCLFGAPVWGYKSGGPLSACNTLSPSHHGLPPQSKTSPFSITAAVSGAGVKVIISASQGGTYQGFMVQGRDAAKSSEALGSFSVVPNDAQSLNCGTGKANTVTHRSSSVKSSLEFVWLPPPGFHGAVIFEGSVLQDFSTFWNGVRSDKLDVVSSAGQSETGSTHATSQPNLGATSDPIYDGCHSNKVCFGVPPGCVESTACDSVVTCLVNSNTTEFEMRSKGSAYVAVGLSNDAKMGNDSVVECVRSSPGKKPDLFVSWNVAGRKANSRMNNALDMGVSLVSGSDINGDITCKFKRNVVTTVNSIGYNLAGDPYFLLLASGSSVDGGKIGYHDVVKASTSEALLLTSGGVAVHSECKVLQRLHAAAMLLAWILAASLGILLARYFKQTWVGSQLCSKAQWFAWHQALMAATWVLTIFGFVIIFVEVQGWSEVSNPHPILGVITTGLAFVQPFMAFLRPPPDSTKRPLFNWAHFAIGNLAHLLAVVTIFFATTLEDADLSSWFIWLLVFFVGFYLLAHVVLTVTARSSAKKLNELANNNLQMTNLRGPEVEETPAPPSDAPYSSLRKAVLILYLTVIILLSVALVIVAVISPLGR